jgi:hypothetical protein
MGCRPSEVPVELMGKSGGSDAQKQSGVFCVEALAKRLGRTLPGPVVACLSQIGDIFDIVQQSANITS